MKKKIIILSISFFIVLIGTAIGSFYLGSVWYYDNSRVIEEVSGYVKEGSGANFAVSLKDNGSALILTLYTKYTYPVKTIRTYNIVDDKVASVTSEVHCGSKFEATEYVKGFKDNHINVKVKDNIVTGTAVTAEVGRTKAEVLQELNKLKEIYTVIVE